MVDWAQAMKTPERPRQNAVGEFIPLTPPLVPDSSHVMICAGLRASQFSRQQTANPKQSRLGCERIGSARGPAGTQFSEALHGPNVMLVAQCAKQAFPQ